MDRQSSSVPSQFARELKTALRTAGAGSSQVPEEPFVFLAYDRRDKVSAQIVVDALRERGIVVRWDRDFRAGINFRFLIPDLIKAAVATIVIWTSSSVRSEFVIDEAVLAKTLGKLVPLIADDLDPAALPFGFGSLHSVPVGALDDVLLALGEKGAAPACR